VRQSLKRKESELEAFIATLLGAFLGVSCPFIIAYFIEKRSYRKNVNLVFIKCNMFYSMLLNVNKVVLPRMQKMNEVERRLLLITNIGNYIDIAQLIPQNQWKFIKQNNQYNLLLSEQNVRVTMSNLLEGSLKTSEEIQSALGILIEASARRIWAIFLLSNRRKLDMEFEKTTFLKMIGSLNDVDNKDVFKLKMK